MTPSWPSLSVVIFNTNDPDSPAGGQYAAGIFNHVGTLLAPTTPPNMPIQVTHLPS